MSKLSYKSLFIIFFFLLVGVVILSRFILPNKTVSASWWNESWRYRKSISVNNTGGNQSNVYLTLTIDTSDSTRFQNDCGDIRFTDQSSNLLDYYLVSGCGTSSTSIHVNFSSLINGASTFYLYYGNSSAQDGFSSSDFSTAATNSTPTTNSEELSPAPIAYWKFDEGSGTIAYDSIGSNNGTLSTGESSPTWANESECISEKCLSFDGTSNYISTPYIPKINSNQITISAWIKPNTISGTHDISNQGQWDGGPWTGWRFQQTGSNITFKLGDGTSTPYTYSAGTLSSNIWQHVVGVWDGSYIRIYINGKEIGNSAKTFTYSGNSSTHWIGKYPGSAYFYSGFLDEVKIYPYARTADQIKQDYNSRGSTKGSSVILGNYNNIQSANDGLLAYWSLNEGVGTSVYDKSGNNINGSFGIGSSGPSWSSGKFSNGLDFSSGTKFVKMTTSSQFATNVSGRSFSYSLWFKSNDISSSTRQVLISNNVACNNPGSFTIDLQSGSMRFMYYSTALPGQVTHSFTPSITLQNNTWYHLEWTKTFGQTGVKAYLNGIEQTVSGDNTATGNTTNMVILGAYNGTGSTCTNGVNESPPVANFSLNGSLDEVKIYNYIRTPTQVIEDMNSSSLSTNNLSKNLIAHYKFDEGNGSTVYDSSGNNLNGSFLGPGNSGPSWTNDAKSNKALSFGGDVQSIFVPNSSSIGLTDNFTISTWVYPREYPSGGVFKILIGKVSTWTNGYALGSNNGNFQFLITNGVGYTIASDTSSYSLNKWYFLTATYSNSILRFYVNGNLKDQKTVPNVVSSSNDFYVGGANGASNRGFNSIIDEVKIYNKALTDQEIKQDYNQGSAVQFGSTNQTIGGTTTSLEYCLPGDTSYCASPVAEWKMDEGVGTSIIDTSGNNNNSSFVNSPTWTQGKTGKAIYLGSNTSYLNTPVLSPTINTQKLTISGWFNINSLSGIQRLISISNSSPMFGFTDTTFFVHTTTSNGSDTNNPYFTLPTNCRTGWHFLTATWDTSLASNNINVFCDGISIGSGTLINGINGTFNISSFWIGHSSQSFIGKVDHIKIYNYARTPAQIAYDYNKGGPVGWWKFDECQGNIAYDWSGIGNTGAINIGPSGSQNSLGTCQVGTSAAWTNSASGKINSSLSFDGTDDYVNVPNNNSLNPGNSDFSISMWIFKNNPTASYKGIFTKNYQQAFGIFDTTNLANDPIGLYIKSGSNANNINFSNYYGKWTHLTWTVYNSTNKQRSYVNGIFNNETNFTVGDVTSTNSINIGRYSYDQSKYFEGKLDDVQIYNYALTSEQVKQVYNGGAVNFR